ncbi:uncharacterized protein LOC131432300 isoform X2 [Malaya genurostris]|uniref:uncharacterized protein LOC131432300 isoform X2 n=1 Tax=Malaya genurostris TaxID=325434 RepID=UPI0026F3F0CC|nr:uncharacterized protein LOC131432300 isoform X2 [Malaya genurostris]
MSVNTFTKYTKYTIKELESYVANPEACIQKIEWIDFVAVLPKYLGNISEGIRACLSKKIGAYDRKVDGIILSFKNTKILNQLSAIRSNSAQVYVKVKTELYVFRPTAGSVIGGTVQYVSSNYISAVIYRVFNVTIKLQTQKLQNVKRGSEIKFVVKSYDMKNDLPYIEGELVRQHEDITSMKTDSLEIEIDKHQLSNGNVKLESISESCSSDPDTLQQRDTANIEKKNDPGYKMQKNKDSSKSRKRKKEINDPLKNNNLQSDIDMNESINAILRNFEMDIQSTTNSPSSSSKKLFETIIPEANISTDNSKLKKKKPSLKMELLEAEILRKYSSSYHEDSAGNVDDSLTHADTKDGPNSPRIKKRKKSKNLRTHGNEDDFETSIMSSILKCATEAGAIASKLSLKKDTRKSVRFDDTITEASFSALDSSDLLDISQLKSPRLSSTLNGNDCKYQTS